jgi:hypothetical protein
VDGVFCRPLPVAVGKFVHTEVLYCAHIPLYQSGIAGRYSRMYFWICECTFRAALTFVDLSLFSLRVSAHGAAPACVKREKFANVCESAIGRWNR